MTVVSIVAYAALSGGALFSLARLIRGPSLLDRVVAADTVLVIVAAALAAVAGLDGNTTVVPVLVVVSLLGFLGSIAVVRYVGGMLIRSDGGDVQLPPPGEDGER